jgi:hypothetical protein
MNTHALVSCFVAAQKMKSDARAVLFAQPSVAGLLSQMRDTSTTVPCSTKMGFDSLTGGTVRALCEDGGRLRSYST